MEKLYGLAPIRKKEVSSHNKEGSYTYTLKMFWLARNYLKINEDNIIAGGDDVIELKDHYAYCTTPQKKE